MKAYLLPGLGTDHRIFKNLIPLLPFEEYEFLDFREDLTSQSNSINDYVKLLADNINHSPNSVIIGLSLGGIIATELSKLIPHQRLILISSIKTINEAPRIIMIAKAIKFYKLVPLWFSRNIVPLLSLLSGVTDKEGYILYRKMLKCWSAEKFKWARKSVIHWNNESPPDCLHIHGTKDNIFPYKRVKSATFIKNGSHYMVMNKAEEIAKIIRKELGIQTL